VRIEKGDKLAGVPIEKVRELLRRCVGIVFPVNYLVAELGISVGKARRVAKALLQAGYVREVTRHGERARYFERTLDGSRLAAATMAAPLRRPTVERLLEALVERARKINADDAYAFRVARILLFGSAMTEVARPNDVDVAVLLSKRFADEAVQERVEKIRRRAAWERGKRFRNMVDEIFWPQTEVLLALRQRSRGLSFSDGDAPSRLGTTSEVIFEDVPSKKSRRGR
jgi:predicted nucleotidyltransferase